MTFSALTWAYKEIPTAVKLNQLVENIVAHDHRSDGSQGSPLIGEWTTLNLTAGAGWNVGTNRYRSLLRGTVLQYDMSFTRTGSTISFADHQSNSPGNVAGDPVIATNAAAAARPDSNRYLMGVRYGVHYITWRITPTGAIELTDGIPGVTIESGQAIECRGISWLD